MHITLSPIRGSTPLTLSRSADALTINEQTFDFAALPEGALLPRSAVACDLLASDVERVDGQIRLTLYLPHGAEAPEETRFPAPITVIGDGPVALPAYDNPTEEE